MPTIPIILQVVVALGVLNVWLLRCNKPSAWRGGDAKNMREEFAAYGLSATHMKIVGGLKILLALMLLAGIWINPLVFPAALGMAILMAGAIAMHIKVKDSPQKSLPAFSMLVLSLLLLIL